MSKWREKNRNKNAFHGNNTLIVQVPEGLTLGSARHKAHGSRCGHCANFPLCSEPQIKKAKTDSPICLWEKNRFTKKENISA